MDSTADFHPQDWLLIAEALASWASEFRHADVPEKERAWELIETIADEQGVEPDELASQAEIGWDGRNQ
jgi:hypothetical protein